MRDVIHQQITQEAQRREAALLDAILCRLCDHGRILPGEEIYREPWGNGGTVAYSLPNPATLAPREQG